eukprot:m51a1_g4523 hypothetical protein (259) ;mRNA; f:865-1900
MAEPALTTPRLLLSFTSLNGHNRRLQRLELVVPESWRVDRHMSSDEIVIAVVRAMACCCPDRDAALEDAGVVKCPLCARVILVQLNASSDLLDSHTVVLPNGPRVERFSFAIRSQCIHQVIDAAWVRVQLGDYTILSASSFSLNNRRTRGSQAAASPAPLTRRVIVRVMIHMHMECDQDILPVVLCCTSYIRATVAGCTNMVVRCMSDNRVVIVAVWENQQAMSYADEIYARCKQADGQQHPATHPRLRLISDVSCVK